MIESYAIDLLYASPEIDRQVTADSIRAEMGSEAADVVHPEDGVVQVTLASTESSTPPSWHVGWPRPLSLATLEGSLQQSWWWPEARRHAQASRFALTLEDRDNRTTDYRRRLGVCQRIAVALIRATGPLAVHWRPSQQLLEPRQLAESLIQDGFGSPLPGGFNVRFFQLEYDDPSEDRELLMDTVGLGDLGLADLQCHFRGLDPEEVSRTLYETGCYQYEHGLVVPDGDTVQGPRVDDRWACTHATALAPPERGVVDLDPGFPFTAGAETV